MISAVRKPYGLRRSMYGDCLMSGAKRDELAQVVATLQPGEIADMMIKDKAEARNYGMLIGVGLGIASCIVLRKIFF